MGNVCTNYFFNFFYDKKIINNFLSKDLYEKELKFKRPTAEVECITDGVKTIVEQLMAAVGNTEPLLGISHQYLVGSMAEETSILEPKEFDFLVVLRHFSKSGAISLYNFHGGNKNEYVVLNENLDLSLYSLRTSDYVIFKNSRVHFEFVFMSKLLKDIISSKAELLHETDHGKLTINSKIVCNHGPASVIKLRWEPKSKSSKSLDILIDITPCIEQKGIDKVLKPYPTQKGILDRYRSHILNDDSFMLIPTRDINVWNSTITTTEMKIVKTLSSHHKTCYMILKYCFNTIVHTSYPHGYIYQTIVPTDYGHRTILSSYLIKTSLLRHVARCNTADTAHGPTEECLFTCLFDITNDLKDSVSKSEIDGILGTINPRISHIQLPIPIQRERKKFATRAIDNVMQRLVLIGKEEYSVDRHEDFRKACHRTSTHHAIQERAEQLAKHQVECHLLLKCNIHIKLDGSY